MSPAPRAGDPPTSGGGPGDQLALGFMEIVICLAQALHEADPQVVQRMNYAAGKAFNRLKADGSDEAAELVYRFGRMLLDPALFPRDDGLPE